MISKDIKFVKHNKFFHSSKLKIVTFSLIFIVFLLYASSLIYPFVWLLFSSLKDKMEYVLGNAFALPASWLFSNFLSAFELLQVDDTNFLGMLFNSSWLTVGMTTLSIFCSSMTAYCIAKYDFKIKNLLYGIAIFMMVIPVVGSLPASYKMINFLKLYDTPMYILTATGGFGFNFIVLYGFFKNISWSYAEAAFVDGGGHFKIFWSVMLPQARSAILSLAIIAAIGSWNDYMTPILYLPSFPTLASGLYEYEQAMVRLINRPVYFAGVIISVIPILIVFIVFQNKIMENVVAGGLKG